MSDHPTLEAIEAFVRGELDAKRARAFVRHLMHGCRTCQHQTGAFTGFREVATSQDYDDAIDRAYAAARPLIRRREREWQESSRILARVEEEGSDFLKTLSPAQCGPALVEALLERSWALRHDKPEEMVEFAEYATLAARDMDTATYGVEQSFDLRCRALAELGNAYRVAERPEDALDAFHRSYSNYLLGSQDKLLLARLFDLQSSFYRACRKIKMARNLLVLVAKIYRYYGQKHLVGRTILKMGIFTGYTGEPEKALRLLARGFQLIEEGSEPELVFAAVHNQLWFLADSGRFEEAQKQLFLNRWRYEGAARLNRLKLRWLEARIDAGLGKHERAVDVFREVREGFEQAGQGFPAAQVSLDMALSLMRRGRISEARELALEAAETFRALQVEREMLSAALFLREAFMLGVAKATLLEDVIDYLRRAEHDPEARFNPRPL